MTSGSEGSFDSEGSLDSSNSYDKIRRYHRRSNRHRMHHSSHSSQIRPKKHKRVSTGWSVYQDHATGEEFFYNHETRERRWIQSDQGLRQSHGKSNRVYGFRDGSRSSSTGSLVVPVVPPVVPVAQVATVAVAHVAAAVHPVPLPAMKR